MDCNVYYEDGSYLTYSFTNEDYMDFVQAVAGCNYGAFITKDKLTVIRLNDIRSVVPCREIEAPVQENDSGTPEWMDQKTWEYLKQQKASDESGDTGHSGDDY